MPTARLPDINSAFVRDRETANKALREKDFMTAMGALQSYNALLPEKNRIKISTAEYRLATQTKIWYVCSTKDCPKTPYQDTIRYRRTLPAIEALARNCKTVMVWRCSNCNAVKEISDTRVQRARADNPSYHQVVPEPPSKTDIFSSYEYEEKLAKWAWNFLIELDHQAAEYRDEHWTREDEAALLDQMKVDEK